MLQNTYSMKQPDSSIYYGGAKPFFHTTVFDGTSTKTPTNKNMARAPF